MLDRSRRADEPALEALRLHPFYRGKIQTALKCPIRTLDDFAVWYTPGVAASSRAIAADPELVYSHTNKANTIAIVSDGSRVLGLGDIGPEAGLAVMEGKALLFKYLGGVDAVPICVDAHSPDDIVRLVEMLQPSFGAVNLEDISQPKCFEVLDRLRASMRIPVWHDDQQGTATVVIAALRNALEIVGKSIDAIDIALIGMGAANVAVFRLLEAAGIDPAHVVACDSTGVLGPDRRDIEQHQLEFRDKWRVCSRDQRPPAFRRHPRGDHRRRCLYRLLETGSRHDRAGLDRRDGRRRDRVRLRQSDTGDLAVGRHRGGCSDRVHRSLRLPEPGQQLARLPGHLPRRARRACQHASPTRWRSPPPTCSPDTPGDAAWNMACYRP